MASVTDSKLSFRKRPLLVMAVVLVVGVGFALWFAASVKKVEELEWEAAKVGLEVGVVAVAAALLSFVADDYKHAQEERRFREDFLRSIAERITASYHKSKGARRMARARGLIPTLRQATHVRRTAYDEFMSELNEAQLELEAVERDLETSSSEFPSDECARRYVESMEERLGDIIKQYEGARPTADEDETKLSLQDVGYFAAFVNPKNKSDFKEYSTPHRKVRKSINKELFLLASGVSPKKASEQRRQALDVGDDGEEGEVD